LGQQLKATELIKLEKELNNVLYFGIPIGGLLAFSFEQINKNQQHFPWQYKLVIYKNVLKNLIFGFETPFLLNNKVIITKHGANAHLNKMMDPLVKHWNKQTVLFQSKEIPIATVANSIISFQSSVRLSRVNQFKVVKEWVRLIKKITKHINSTSLNSKLKSRLKFDLLIQLCKVQFWINYFEQETPNIIITDYDRGHHTAPLVLAANKFNIPTIVIQHGVISPSYGFIPLLANKVCVWGNIQKKQYIDAGEEKEKIYVTGTPVIDLTAKGQKSFVKIKEAYGFDIEKKQIAIGINPIETKELIKFINDFLLAVKDIEHVEPIIKLHPAQSKAYIKSICQCPNNVLFFDKGVPNEAFFGLIDGLIVHNSGLGIEAVQYDVPVAVYTNLNSSLGNGQIMIETNQAIAANSVNELSEWIKNISNNEYSSNLEINKDEFYRYTGNEAVEEIIKVIENL